MRLLLIIAIVAALALTTSAAKKKKAKAKASGEQMEAKYSALLDTIGGRAMYRADHGFYERFVEQGPRNYSVVMMLTALDPRQGCRPCRFAKDEFQLVAESWKQSEEFSRDLVFVLADYQKASEIFQKMNIQTVPVIQHFPATGRPKSADTFRSQMQGLEADAVAKFVHQRTGRKIAVKRPVDVVGMLIKGALVALVLVLAYFFLPTLRAFWQNSAIWAMAAVLFALVFISGQMWNTIRNPPAVGANQDGTPAYFAGGTQSQYVVETQIVFAIYFLIFGCGTGLAFHAPTITSAAQQSSLVTLYTVGLAFSISLLMYVFRMKQGGYPFRLLL